MGKEFDDLSGRQFGIWKVIAFDHMKWNGVNHKHGMSYYKCKCMECGQICLKARSNLLELRKYHHGCKVNCDANII